MKQIRRYQISTQNRILVTIGKISYGFFMIRLWVVRSWVMRGRVVGSRVDKGGVVGSGMNWDGEGSRGMMRSEGVVRSRVDKRSMVGKGGVGNKRGGVMERGSMVNWMMEGSMVCKGHAHKGQKTQHLDEGEKVMNMKLKSLCFFLNTFFLIRNTYLHFVSSA